MALPYAKIILDRLKEELKPRGFKKNGQTFVRPVNDCFQIVTLQADSGGWEGNQSYCVRLAVYGNRLEPLAKESSKLKEYQGHWRASLGDFLGEKREGSWTVRNDNDAAVAAKTMVALLPVALAEMDGISSYEAILNIPHGMGASSDEPPGFCQWHLIDAARVREGLPPSVELPYVKGQRDAWHRRHFPDYIPPERKPNPLVDAIHRSRELGKSLPGITLITPDGVVAPMADPEE